MLTGQVEVTRAGAPVARLDPGEHFGELSLIDEQPRSAHVIAMEDTNVLVLRSDDFRRRVEANPAVAWVLMQELSRRLRRLLTWSCHEADHARYRNQIWLKAIHF